MSDIVERARAYLAANAAESGADVLIAEQADRIEDLENQLATINPAMKCRDGCAVVKERFG